MVLLLEHRWLPTVLGTLGLLLIPGCEEREGTGQSNALRVVPLTRVIRIPAASVPAGAARAPEAPERAVTVSRSAEEELPVGPQGFDVLDDGSLVLTDPLGKRLAFFSAQGGYLEEKEIGFAAMSVTRQAGGELRLRSPSTGEYLVLDQEGQTRRLSGREAAGRIAARRDAAKLVTLNEGLIERRGPDGTRRGGLGVTYDGPLGSMVALESIGTDVAGHTYVVIELAQRGETLQISKLVRKYASDGVILCQIQDIPLNYYVHPVDEFRVREGVVYQLQPKETEVLINVWDTND